ncbi:MAG: hypothetical protein K5682_06395 [Lachnospiraceae bacterium]|nr:hypothetical protein [Lachnospiraceae bacterium]
MGNENGTWIMYGVGPKDPNCLHTVEEATAFIEKTGFLPLFKNEIPGFSLEERTQARYWWSDQAEKDPWIWREIIARRGVVAYGKFFDKKAGFISREWLPYFVNYRRNGYDYDAAWEDGILPRRQMKILELFENEEIIPSYEIKKRAGFGKGGEKNFDGTITDLQMHLYLCMRDFKKRKNKAGEEYGWDVALYAMPEQLFGYQYVTGAYKEAPEVSGKRIAEHIREHFPEATEKQIRKMLK